MAIDPWSLWGFGVSPYTPQQDISSIVAQTQGLPVGGTNIWDAIAKVGSAAVQTFLTPSPQANVPGLPSGVEQILREVGVAVPPQPSWSLAQQAIMANALPARCATTAGMAGLPCVVHQGGPYKGKLVKSNRRRKVKLVPDGQGSFTPVICCSPRRMNPLNPRALRRAAVRLGRFQHIASTVEKMIARAVKTRHRSRRSFGAPRSSRCLPARCG